MSRILRVAPRSLDLFRQPKLAYGASSSTTLGPPSGAIAWFKKGVGVTQAANLVTAWADQSGNANNLSNAGGTARPTLQGDNSILFDGVANTLATAGFTFAQPATYYFLINVVTWQGNKQFLDGATDVQIFDDTTTPNISLWAGAGAATNTNLTVGAWHMVQAVFNGASSRLKVDATTTTTGNPSTNNPGGITIGSGRGGIACANVYIKEVIAYAAAHTDTEAATVATYFNTL